MADLCFGGSFNPIHTGHLRCAEAARISGGFDRVVLIPSAVPPHKRTATDLASPADRLAMCKLAAVTLPEFVVDDLELQRAGPSYTFDTAAELRRRGWPSVAWLIGADQLLGLSRWHRAEELIDQVHFVIVARPGWELDWSLLPPAFAKLQANVVIAPLVGVSATDIRRRVRAGEPIDGLTAPVVIRYIADHGLYRD